MIVEENINLGCFNKLHRSYRERPEVDEAVDRGDREIYAGLNPLERRAYNYRDSIEVLNHITGVEIARILTCPQSKVLYLASSYGMGPLLIEGNGPKVVCVDVDTAAQTYAKDYVKQQITTDARVLPFLDGVFDLVLSRDFLAKDYKKLSLFDHAVVTHEVHRVLKSGAFALFYTLYTLDEPDGSSPLVRKGLPYLEILKSKFGNISLLKAIYDDSPQQNSLAYLAIKQ